jgi:hypothetical protein
MSSTFVIPDSSALIAQINVKDLWHKKASTISEFIERTDRKVVLPARYWPKRSTALETT